MPDAKTRRARVDAAVNAQPTVPEAQQVEMVQVQIGLNSGRPAVVAIPKDITELELLSFFGQMLALGDQLRAQRPTSRIVLP
jgi:hypothetical protein